MAAGVIIALIAAAVATKAAADALHKAAMELEDVSVDLSGASAINDYRMELARIERADRIGPGLARFEEMRGRILEQIYEIGTEILDLLVTIFDAVRPLLEGMVHYLELSVNILGVVVGHMKVMIDVLTLQVHKAMKDMQALAERWAELWRQLNPAPDPIHDPFMQDFLRGLPWELPDQIDPAPAH